MATTTLSDVETELQTIGQTAINNMDSATLRKIADFIDQFAAIQASVDTEKAALDALESPPATS